MKLKSPQPNQSFFGLRNSGRSYTSNAACFIYPVDAADANELRGFGCVDVVEHLIPKVEPLPERKEPAQGGVEVKP